MMKKSVGLLVAAVGAFYAYAVAGKKGGDKPSSGAVPGLPNPGTQTIAKCQFDANIPPPVAAGVEALLYGPIAPKAAELRSAADMVQGQGYPLAAGCLRARAAELESQERRGSLTRAAGTARALRGAMRNPFQRA